MSEKNSDEQKIAIKRITTPLGDVPTVDSVMQALNVIIDRIKKLATTFNEKMKFSGASLEASEYIELNLSETNQKINDLKKKLAENSDHIEEINTHVQRLDGIVTGIENITRMIANSDITSPSKGYEEILEIKNLTKELRESFRELQKSVGAGIQDFTQLFWEFKAEDIKEKLSDFAAYEPLKQKILGFFRILNLPKPILEIDSKILLIGRRGVGKTTLIRAIARNQNIPILELNLPLIISLKPPQQVEGVNNLFYSLKDNEDYKPCVLLLDNLEILQQIQNDPQYLPLIQTLNLEINKIHLTKEKMLVIGIFNGQPSLKKEIITCFNEILEMKSPDQISRAHILRKILNKTNLEMDIDLDEISSQLAEPSYTDGFNGKDLKEITNVAKLQAFLEGRTLLNENDLANAIDVIKKKQGMQNIQIGSPEPKHELTTDKQVQNLQEELFNLKMLLSNSMRMAKHGLRLALTDNYPFITRLFNHYEMTKKGFSIRDISQITGVKEEQVMKLLKKMPYRMLFPKIGEYYYVIFDKSTLDEVLAELALSL
ncbi:MAG: AAA family ATPase [Candidatus Helarchaeota archaeon]